VTVVDDVVISLVGDLVSTIDFQTRFAIALRDPTMEPLTWASRIRWLREVHVSSECIKIPRIDLTDDTVERVFRSACRDRGEFLRFCKVVRHARDNVTQTENLTDSWDTLGRFIFTLIYSNMIMTLLYRPEAEPERGDRVEKRTYPGTEEVAEYLPQKKSQHRKRTKTRRHAATRKLGGDSVVEQSQTNSEQALTIRTVRTSELRCLRSTLDSLGVKCEMRLTFVFCFTEQSCVLAESSMECRSRSKSCDRTLPF
jgi:hypothetical protein